MSWLLYIIYIYIDVYNCLLRGGDHWQGGVLIKSPNSSCRSHVGPVGYRVDQDPPGQKGESPWAPCMAPSHEMPRDFVNYFRMLLHEELLEHMKAKRRVCGERGSAKIAYTKLVHQKYLPQSSAKVSGISLQSVLLLAHHSTNCPRTALGSTKVTRLPRR